MFLLMFYHFIPLASKRQGFHCFWTLSVKYYIIWQVSTRPKYKQVYAQRKTHFRIKIFYTKMYQNLTGITKIKRPNLEMMNKSVGDIFIQS